MIPNTIRYGNIVYFINVWYLSTLYELFVHVIQGQASSIVCIWDQSSILEICREMKHKSACIPMTNSLSTVYVLLGLEMSFKKSI